MSISPVVEVYLSGDRGWLGDGLGEEGGRPSVSATLTLCGNESCNEAASNLLLVHKFSTNLALSATEVNMLVSSFFNYFPQHWGSVGWLSYYAATNPATKLFWPPCPRPRRWLRPADKRRKNRQIYFSKYCHAIAVVVPAPIGHINPNVGKFNFFDKLTMVSLVVLE